MSHPFDPGPVEQPFAGLAADYPGVEAYDPQRFRTEWGPIFHRGRLDGSARMLVLGQDPGQHESIARRCLVGEAGQRVQGFLWKLGLERSYVMVNAFLYSVYGQPPRQQVEQLLQATARYRKRWLDALLDGTDVKAVVAFGDIAEQAFLRWRRNASGKRFKGHFEPLTHPTMPDATARPRQRRLPGGDAAPARGVERRPGAPRRRTRPRARPQPRARPLRRAARSRRPQTDPRAGHAARHTALDALAQAVGHPQGHDPRGEARHDRGRVPTGERPSKMRPAARP